MHYLYYFRIVLPFIVHDRMQSREAASDSQLCMYSTDLDLVFFFPFLSFFTSFTELRIRKATTTVFWREKPVCVSWNACITRSYVPVSHLFARCFYCCLSFFVHNVFSDFFSEPLPRILRHICTYVYAYVHIHTHRSVRVSFLYIAGSSFLQILHILSITTYMCVCVCAAALNFRNRHGCGTNHAIHIVSSLSYIFLLLVRRTLIFLYLFSVFINFLS